MGLFDLRDTADSMADLLDRERGAILSGRFDLLERLAPEKERLAAKLNRNRMDPATVSRLRQKAEHNGRLLDAMRVGLKDAGARLNALRQAPEALHTYDASGRRTVIGSTLQPKKLL